MRVSWSCVPQVGTFVAPIDLAAVHDSQFVRETLECRTVVLAAERIDAAGKARLDELVAQQQAAMLAGDRPSFFSWTRVSMPSCRALPAILRSGA
jgi:DNA-binding GntR family transcriptional regulator